MSPAEKQFVVCKKCIDRRNKRQILQISPAFLGNLTKTNGGIFVIDRSFIPI